jgi:hypothetical protein
MLIPAEMGHATLPDTSNTESCALQWLGIDMLPMDALIISSNILPVHCLLSPSACEGVFMSRHASNNNIELLFFF